MQFGNIKITVVPGLPANAWALVSKTQIAGLNREGKPAVVERKNA